MSIKSLLKKEGINVVKELGTKEVQTIAKDISIKLCLAFPEHNLSRNELCRSLAKVKMYLANLPKDFSGAKYILENNSIYFNNSLPFEEIPNTAMHECIHFIQHNNSNTHFGLCTSQKGISINEAAVQLMASEANMSETVEVKYFDISLKTNTPNYYPLECALLNQVAYFTGTFPLFNSVLFSNDIFKNTFITKFDKKLYTYIIDKLDNLLDIEGELNSYIEELSNATRKSTIKNLNKLINYNKQKIAKLFFQTQNHIMTSCFNYEFNKVKTLEDIHILKNKLYDYKNVIGSNSTYTFYNDFYCSMMNIIETKKQYIKEHGSLGFTSKECTSLMVINTRENKIAFARTFFKKLKQLFKSEKSIDYINE